MLLDNPGASLGIAARAPRNRLNQHLHRPSRRDAEQAHAKQAAELTRARIVLTTSAPPRGANSKPDFVADGRAIHSLQDQFEAKSELQFANDERCRLTAGEGNQITAAHLSLDLESQLFEEPLYGEIEAGFQGASFVSAGEDNGLKLIPSHVEERGHATQHSSRSLMESSGTRLQIGHFAPALVQISDAH